MSELKDLGNARMRFFFVWTKVLPFIETGKLGEEQVGGWGGTTTGFEKLAVDIHLWDTQTETVKGVVRNIHWDLRREPPAERQSMRVQHRTRGPGGVCGQRTEEGPRSEASAPDMERTDVKIKWDCVQEMLSKDPGRDKHMLGRAPDAAPWKVHRCLHRLRHRVLTRDYEIAIHIFLSPTYVSILICNTS